MRPQASKANGKRGKSSAPISRHPLFPMMIGLWFAALFGLGSLAIRPALLESAVLALKLDLIVPAAAPPLGFTSRILLAFLMFVLGGAVGFFAARRIGRGVAGKPATSRFSQPMRKSAAVAVPDEDFARLDAARSAQGSVPMAGRRRALAMEEDYSAEFHHDFVPIPGGAPQILDLADLGPMGDLGAQSSGVADYAQEQTPASAESEPQTSFDPWHRHPEPLAKINEQLDPAPTVTEACADDQVAPVIESPAEPAERQYFGCAPQHSEAVQAPAEAPTRSFAAPQPEAEPELSATADFATSEMADEASQDPQSAVPAAESQMNCPTPTASLLGQLPADAAGRLAAAPIESLGVVQLAERLALAISRRRSGAAEHTAAAAVRQTAPVFAPPVAQETATPEAQVIEPEVSPVSAAIPDDIAPPPPSAMPIPAALRPLSFEHIEEDDVLDALLPPRRFTMPVTAPEPPAALQTEAAAPHAEAAAPIELVADHADDEDDGFGSLLGMKPPARQAFVRIDDAPAETTEIEPVVVFPGQAVRSTPFGSPSSSAFQNPADTAMRRFDAPPTVPGTQRTLGAMPAATHNDSAETERALKAALATLQRMSGAA